MLIHLTRPSYKKIESEGPRYRLPEHLWQIYLRSTGGLQERPAAGSGTLRQYRGEFAQTKVKKLQEDEWIQSLEVKKVNMRHDWMNGWNRYLGTYRWSRPRVSARISPIPSSHSSLVWILMNPFCSPFSDRKIQGVQPSKSWILMDITAWGDVSSSKLLKFSQALLQLFLSYIFSEILSCPWFSCPVSVSSSYVIIERAILSAGRELVSFLDYTSSWI